MLAQYFDDTLAQGFAAQNQMISSLSAMLLGQNKTGATVMAAREENTQKVPVYQADLTRIQEAFMAAIKEVKKEVGSDLAAAKALSKETTEELFSTLTKGQDILKPHITPEDIANAVTDKIAAVDGVDRKALDNFNQALLGLMQTDYGTVR